MANIRPKEPDEVEVFDSSNPLHYWIIKRYPFYLLFNPSTYKRIGIVNLIRYLIQLGLKSDWAEIRYEIWRIFGARLFRQKHHVDACARATEEVHDKITVRIAVVMHLHYPDIWPELRSYLDHIPVPFDLYVSLTDTLGFNAEDKIRQEFPAATIRIVSNRGRDILAFQKFADVVLDPSSYDLICKIHSKASAHMANGDEWRRDLLDGVLGSTRRVLELISCFKSNPEIGMIAGSSCFASFGIHTLSEGLRGKVDQLANRLNINRDSDDFVFVAGTMFWARVTALADLRHLNLRDEDFEMEDGQADGLLAHAYERFFGLQIFSRGFHYSAMPTHRIRPFWLSGSYRYLQGFPKKNA